MNNQFNSDFRNEAINATNLWVNFEILRNAQASHELMQKLVALNAALLESMNKLLEQKD